MSSLPVCFVTRGQFGVARIVTRRVACFVLAAQLVWLPGLAAGEKDKPAAKAAPAADALLQTMQAELNRAKTDLAKSDPAPYFLSYTVYDQDQIFIAGAYGALLSDMTTKRRNTDVTMRVGTSELDDTHGLRRSRGLSSGKLPLAGDADATERALWEMPARQDVR